MAVLGWGLGLLVGALLAFGAQRLRGDAARALAMLGLLAALGWTVVWGPTALNPAFELGGPVLIALGIGWLLGVVLGLPRAVARRGREAVWIGPGIGLLLVGGGVLLVAGVGALPFDPEARLSGGFGRGLLVAAVPAVILAAILDRRPT